MPETVDFFWLDQGWVDHFPEGWFQNQGVRKAAKYKYSDPMGKRFLAQCDVTTKGNMAELDYRPYHHFNAPGGWTSELMRIGFSDQTRNCIAKVTWAGQRVAFTVNGPVGQDTAEADIEDVDKSNLSKTEKDQLIAARKGQGKFRKELDGRWGGACAVTGIQERALLRASHIKPWSSCSNKQQRLSHANGILLAAHLDALFDRYLISFTSAGKMLKSLTLKGDWKLLGLPPNPKLRKPLHPLEKKYLKQHRALFKTAEDARLAGAHQEV